MARPADPMDRAALLERLGRHRMLRQVDRGELENLLSFAQPRALAARARLFAAGDAGSAVYVLLSGWMKFSREAPAGRDVVLEVAGAGTVFGELAVLTAAPRAADATALTVCRVLSIDGRAFTALLRRHPDALLELVRVLAERLARTTTQVEDNFLPAEARLARSLIRLAALGDPVGDALRIDLGLSQRELGEISGLARERINKQLSLWREAGLVDMQGRTLVLTDGPALAEIAEANPP